MFRELHRAKPLTAPMLLIVVSVLTGCTSVPNDLGRADVDALIMERGQSSGEERDELLQALRLEPLTAELAMRVALVNNPHLQAAYAELGFAAADVYEAGRIRNPVFSASILDPSRSGERDQLTFGLVTSFTDLITLPARKRLATAEFDALKHEVGAAVLATAADTQSTYYRYVAAQQVAALRQQTAKAAGLSLELATRYHDAGNLTPREFALSKASAANANIEALEAQSEAFAMRTELAQWLGVSVGSVWDAPAQLPLPLDHEDKLEDLLALAKQSRLDLIAAHSRTSALADRLGVTGWTRWLGDLDIGVERERETDGGRLTGPTVDWEIPLFSQNRDQLLRVDAELQIALADLAALTTAVDNEVRLAAAATQNAKARADEYREQLIPARIAATNRAQEEENFMLIGIFELIESKQDEYDSYQGYLEAVRDYWLARTELSRAVGNTLPSAQHVGSDRLDVNSFIEPADADPPSMHKGNGRMDSAPKPMKEEDPHKDHSAHQGGSQ